MGRLAHCRECGLTIQYGERASTNIPYHKECSTTKQSKELIYSVLQTLHSLNIQFNQKTKICTELIDFYLNDLEVSNYEI